MSEKPLERPLEKPSDLPSRLKEMWGRTVGNYATDERGTQSLLDRLVEFGHLTADEAKKVLGDARARIEENKGELDKRVDASIKATFERFTDGKEGRELKKLEERLNELEAKVKELDAR